MSNTNKGGPAFPSKKRVHRAGYATAEFEPVDGMTLRDYFAAKAMQAMLSSPNCPVQVEEEELAQQAYQTADAMLKARSA